jgi:hypothetical protein
MGRRKAEPPERWSQDKIEQSKKATAGMRSKAEKTHDPGLLKGAQKIEEKVRQAEDKGVHYDTW